jgi:hypothetical protein
MQAPQTVWAGHYPIELTRVPHPTRFSLGGDFPSGYPKTSSRCNSTFAYWPQSLETKGAPPYAVSVGWGFSSQFPVTLQLRLQICQRLLQHLAVPRIACDLQLLQNPLPRKLDALSALFFCNLFRSFRRSRGLTRRRLFLLLLDRLALPSAGHVSILQAQGSPKPRCPSIFANDKWPTTNNQRPTTNDQQATTNLSRLHQSPRLSILLQH